MRKHLAVCALLLLSVLGCASVRTPAQPAHPTPPPRAAGPHVVCDALSFARTDYSVAGRPWSLGVGDFNQDGKLDLVTANQDTNSVAILLGHGDGTFDPAVSFTTPSSPLCIAVADFNRDGKLDVATANWAQSTQSAQLVILPGNGDGTFGPPALAAANIGPPVLVADFNRDGKTDLLGTYTTTIALVLGNGDGTFGPATRFPVGVHPYSLTIADFNADGNPDVAIASYDSSNVVVLLGDGHDSFGPPVPFPTGAGAIAVVPGDFNGDGKLDLATANHSQSAAVSVLLGNGDGTFGPPRSFEGGMYAENIAVGDFNGDGKLDLVVTHNSSVSVLLGNGDGTFAAPADFGAGVGATAVAVGDFNGDTRLDMAVANTYSSTVSVLLNTCNVITPVATDTPTGGPATPTGTPTPSNTPAPSNTPPAPSATSPPGPPTASATPGSLPSATVPPHFVDVSPANPFYSAIETLAGRNVVGGYNCGGSGEPCPGIYFRPNSGVSRGQLLKMAVLAASWPLVVPPDASRHFADVPAAHPFYAYVETAAGRAIIGGYGCGGPGEPCGNPPRPYFRPAASITRGQLAKVIALARALPWPIPTGATFQDVPASHPFAPYVEAVAAAGIVGGYSCGAPGEPCPGRYFRPAAGATRAQTAKFVANSFFPAGPAARPR
ncbi:MAG TPA: FG-GAP-like repeat-containing protein [Chloroflexia bacterium]|nr:FG-GAP-like repeat-containing protein [Chloroflexia bacterium]